MDRRLWEGSRKGVWIEDGPGREPAASCILLGLGRWGRKDMWSVDMVHCGEGRGCMGLWMNNNGE